MTRGQASPTQDDPGAVLSTVRRLAAEDEWHAARVLAERSLRDPTSLQQGRLAAGWLSHLRGWFDAAWQQFSTVADENLAAHVPIAAYESALLSRPSSEHRAAAIVDALPETSMHANAELAARELVRGRLSSARHLASRIGGLDDRPASGRAREILAVCDRLAAPSPVTKPAFAMLYPEAALAPGPGGHEDSLETLGILAHLLSVADLRADGPLGAALGEVSARLEVADMHRPVVDAVAVSRELSTQHDLPAPLWTVLSGGPFHSCYGLSVPLPLHANLRAIFWSFHCPDAAILTPPAIEYLRRCAPIGCRDWATVDLLLGADVDAFFSDSLALASRALTAAGSPGPGDSSTERDVEPMATPGPEHLSTGIDCALELVDRLSLSRQHVRTARVTVSRAAAALGCSVDLAPPRPSVARYDGYLPYPPAAPTDRGLDHRLSETLQAVVEGASERAVREVMRRVCGEAVQTARERRRRPRPHLSAVLDRAATTASVARHRKSFGSRIYGGETVDVAMAFDANLTAQVPVAIASLAKSATAPLRMWLLTRSIDPDWLGALAGRFDGIQIEMLPCDDIQYGDITRMIPHITVSTMDRLLLPDLLPDVPRIVYLDIDALVLGDLTTLYRWDLTGAAFAARSTPTPAVLAYDRIARQLEPADASEFRRLGSRIGPGVLTFNAGVLVLDLDRMRADDFVDSMLPLVPRYGLHDQDLLMVYAGESRAELTPEWNAWPLTEPVDEPAVVHYLGPLKPWGGQPIPGDHWWHRAERLVPPERGG